MKKTTPTILAAAVSGLFLGSSFGCQSSPEGGATSQPANQTDRHACKGMNDCAGKGGCGTDQNSCAGKNACKGKGGCPTAKSSCKGQNDCKTLGGCKTDKNACKGKNDCKNQGGCKVGH